MTNDSSTVYIVCKMEGMMFILVTLGEQLKGVINGLEDSSVNVEPAALWEYFTDPLDLTRSIKHLQAAHNFPSQFLDVE